MGFAYNISATAGASNFKFDTQHGVCQITRRRKGRHGPGLGELSKIWGSPSIFTQIAEASDFKFGTQPVFAKARHKITPREKSGGSFGLGEHLTILGFPIIFL